MTARGKTPSEVMDAYDRGDLAAKQTAPGSGPDFTLARGAEAPPEDMPSAGVSEGARGGEVGAQSGEAGLLVEPERPQAPPPPPESRDTGGGLVPQPQPQEEIRAAVSPEPDLVRRASASPLVSSIQMLEQGVQLLLEQINPAYREIIIEGAVKRNSMVWEAVAGIIQAVGDQGNLQDMTLDPYWQSLNVARAQIRTQECPQCRSRFTPGRSQSGQKYCCNWCGAIAAGLKRPMPHDEDCRRERPEPEKAAA